MPRKVRVKVAKLANPTSRQISLTLGIGGPQQPHRAFDATPLQVPVRRLAEHAPRNERMKRASEQRAIRASEAIRGGRS